MRFKECVSFISDISRHARVRRSDLLLLHKGVEDVKHHPSEPSHRRPHLETPRSSLEVNRSPSRRGNMTIERYAKVVSELSWLSRSGSPHLDKEQQRQSKADGDLFVVVVCRARFEIIGRTSGRACRHVASRIYASGHLATLSATMQRIPIHCFEVYQVPISYFYK